MNTKLTRCETLSTSIGLLVPVYSYGQTAGIATMNTLPIPSTGEALPVIGCGPYIGFDHAPENPGYAELPAVVDTFFTAGGSVIYSSPM